MSHVNLGHYGIHGPSGPTPSGDDSNTAPPIQDITQDSIKAADQMAALMYLMFLPQNPQLIPPADPATKAAELEITKNSVLAFAMSMLNTLSSIANKIAESWSASIKLQNKRNEEQDKEYHKKEKELQSHELQSAIIAKKAEAKAEGTDPTSAALTADNIRATYAVGLSQYVDKVKNGDPTAKANLPFVTASVMISSTFFQDFVDGAKSLANSSVGAVNSLGSAFSSFNLPVTLGAIGGMFGLGATYQTQITTLAEAEETQPKNAEFAKNYALRILEIVKGNGLDNFVSAMLQQKLLGQASITNAGVSQYSAMAKVVLLSVSLALLYKLGMSDNLGGTNWIRGPEFAGMLHGDIPIRGSSPEAEVIAELHRQLANLPSGSSGLRDRFQASIIAYMDSNPSVGTLLEVGDVFEEAYYNTIPHSPPRN